MIVCLLSKEKYWGYFWGVSLKHIIIDFSMGCMSCVIPVSFLRDSMTNSCRYG